MRLDASDLRLTLSPDVLELGSRLAASALEPLMQVWQEAAAAWSERCCASRQARAAQSCSTHRRPLPNRSTLPPSHSLHCLQPKPDQPLAACSQFERVWSFDPAEWAAARAPGGPLAVSLAVTGAEGGVSVWRVRTPTGYAAAGDIVTPGTSQASPWHYRTSCCC